MPLDSVRVGLVVLNFRFPEITVKCLASLSQGDPASFAVFLVDNSPGDGFAEMLADGLAATGREHHYIASPVNHGFGHGMNQGIRAAMDAGCTHIAVLNNDTIASPDFGARLLEEITSNPGDVLAGLVLDADEGAPSFNIGRLRRWTLEVEHVLSRDYTGPVDFVSGCLAIFPVRALEAVGLFREDYFLYAEDTELCVRLKKAGFSFRFCSSIVIWHRPGSSADRTGAPKQYYLIRNHTHLVLLHGSLPQKIVYSLCMAAVLANQIRRPKIFRTVFAAIADALGKRMGIRTRGF